MFAGDGGDIDGFAGFLPSASGLRAHHRTDLLPPPRSPLVAANLCLAAIRRLAGVPGASTVPRLLAQESGRAAAFRDGRTLEAHSPGGNTHGRGRVPAALIGP